MQRSPLILDYYFVKKIRFELKAGFDENLDRDLQTIKSPKLNVDVISGQNSEDPLAWRFELNIGVDEKSSEKDFPYTFDVTIVGFFRVEKTYPSDIAEMLAQVNAPSILYSAAREFLASVTGRSPYSAIILPSISFMPLPEEQKEKEKKSSTKAQKLTEKRTKK